MRLMMVGFLLYWSILYYKYQCALWDWF